MSLILVNDVTNSKLRELKCNSSGELSVEKADVSALATESSLATLNGKVSVCNTGSISGTVAVSAVSGDVACTHASLPLPSGAATESSLSTLNGKVTACDTGSISGTVAVSAVAGSVACTHASLPLPSGAASESSLATLNGKVTACDTSSISGTVACTHASLPLPSGAATETSLSALSACVVAGNKVAVSSSPATLSATSTYVFGTQGNPAAEMSNLDATSSVVDVDAFERVLIAGSTTKLDAEFRIEVSSDNLDYFDLQSVFINVDYSTGHFGVIMNVPFRYIRLKRLGDSSASGTDSLSAIISGK